MVKVVLEYDSIFFHITAALLSGCRKHKVTNLLKKKLNTVSKNFGDIISTASNLIWTK